MDSSRVVSPVIASPLAARCRLVFKSLLIQRQDLPMMSNVKTSALPACRTTCINRRQNAAGLRYGQPCAAMPCCIADKSGGVFFVPYRRGQQCDQTTTRS